ncbi:T9SS type A sorting domain-containing protein [Winogradskyella sp.]|uniref:T9SS type A sorting domain-containing protein n=1 Tax=Winogradskyella sp. TaxID=1883156 RepID=UPI00261FF376|nr:T9SS type A sorting domain-containing protein [Winogradskyella sp.]
MKQIYISIFLAFGFFQLGFGQIGFGEIIIVEGINSVHSVKDVFAGDLDNDGDVDLVSASWFDNKISWYENLNGYGEFGDQQVISNTAPKASAVFIIDVDGDSDNDIVAGYSDPSDYKVVWYENLDGQGTFSTEQVISTDAIQVRSVYACDIDNDGDIDVLSASPVDDKIAWYENLDGEGSFGEQQVITTSTNGALKVHAADIDGDTDMDVLTASNLDDKIAWYENLDGQGTFGEEQVITTNADLAESVFTSDIDNDGDLDVLSASFFDDKIAWYENTNGQGDFGVEQVISTDADGARDVYSIDLDSDGDMDVLSASYLDNKIAWYENLDGSGTFGDQQIVSATNNGAESVFAIDINNDGRKDVLSASFLVNKVAWYKNLGFRGNEISGTVMNDLDNDGCDDGDSVLSNLLVIAYNDNYNFSTFTRQDGTYQIAVDEGNFTTQLENLPQYYTSNPLSATSTFTGIGNTDTVDFCIEPADIFNDLNISVYPAIDEPRPGFDTTYQIVYNNIGTIQLSGDITFEFDDSKIQFLNASETVVSQTANTLTFNYSDLNPFETRTIDLEFNVFPPPTTNIDDVLVSTATINPVSGDETEGDNVFELEQTVIGSYDPNDITVLQGDEIFIEDASKYLDYLIRFQNTGTASAINVSVEHVLDDKLDWSTMQLQSLSHSGRVEITNGSEVNFIFNDIHLPDSTSNEPDSHGYIAFKIKPKSNVQVGDIISGVADIYFDFNPPIITNTVNTEIVEPLSIGYQELRSVRIYPNPARDMIDVISRQIIDEITLIDINGRVLSTIEVSTTDYRLDISALSKGIYFLDIKSGDSTSTKKLIKN